MNTKSTNPKEALGVKKVPLHCVPCAPLMELALAMMEGGRKYGTHNYRAIGVRVSTYYDAVMRHMMSWWEGEDIDPDSGVHHLIKAMACLLVVRDSMLMGNCKDDRPIQYPEKLPIETFNKQAEGIIKKCPECAEPFLWHNKPTRGKRFCEECERKIEQAKDGDLVLLCLKCSKATGVNHVARPNQRHI